LFYVAQVRLWKYKINRQGRSTNWFFYFFRWR